MKIRVLLLLLVLVVFCTGAEWRWLRLRSANFELYTDASEPRGREVVLELEQFRNVFAAQAAGRNISPMPVRVFVFKSEASFQPFQIKSASAGYYHSGADGDYIAMRASGRTAAHEYVHVVVHHAAREIPLWFGEGIADFYSTIQFRGGQMSIGDAVAPHLQLLRTGKMLDLKTLRAVGDDSPHYREKDKRILFYAQSWALMHMLHLSEKYRAGAANFVSRTLQGDPDALRSSFGRPDAEIEKDLRDYVSREPLPRVNLAIAAEGQSVKVAVEPLTELDSALLLAKLFVVSEKRAEAGQFYRAIVKAHPQSGEAEAALGYLALAKSEDDSALEHFRRALELGVRNARLCYDLAMLRRQFGAEERQVWDLLQRSVEFDPRLFESRYFLGSFALERGRPAEAIENLKMAAVLQPNRTEVWENLALAYFANKDRDGASDAASRAVLLSNNDAETARTQATLELVTRPGAVAVGPKPKVRPAETPAASRVEGMLTQIDCLGESARLRIDQQSGRAFLLVREPQRVTLKNSGAVSFEFACGPMEPRAVIVEYMPGRNESYGTAGEVRSLEFR